MNEAETRAGHIDPALQAAGRGVVEGSRVAREYAFTEGRIEGPGKRGRADSADYVLDEDEQGPELLPPGDGGRRGARGAVAAGLSGQREDDPEGADDFAEALDRRRSGKLSRVSRSISIPAWREGRGRPTGSDISEQAI